MGISKIVEQSTLSRANENRDWRIYQDFAFILIKEARRLYSKEEIEGIDLNAPAYALDASTIDLCLSVFPWAKFRKKLNLPQTLYEILQILSLSCFDKTPLQSLFLGLDIQNSKSTYSQPSLGLDL